MTWKDSFRQDITRYSGRQLRGFRLLTKVLGEPGLQFVLLARLQLACEQDKRGVHRWLARAIHLLNLRVTGGEVGHGTVIGPGLVVKHPLGVVLGGGSIGARCTILGKVTIGESLSGDLHDYPRIGDECLIGTSASVIGAVAVGDGCIIGAHALVNRSVPARHRALGVPAVATPIA